MITYWTEAVGKKPELTPHPPQKGKGRAKPPPDTFPRPQNPPLGGCQEDEGQN